MLEVQIKTHILLRVHNEENMSSNIGMYLNFNSMQCKFVLTSHLLFLAINDAQQRFLHPFAVKPEDISRLLFYAYEWRWLVSDICMPRSLRPLCLFQRVWACLQLDTELQTSVWEFTGRATWFLSTAMLQTLDLGSDHVKPHCFRII